MKSTPSSGRARRQLSFATLPYHGQLFYLDIKNSSLKARLCRRILDLGGQIENFLSKDIYLMITEKNEDKVTSKSDLQTFVGKLNIPLSRGQALLHASKNQPANQGQTNDILQNAANMGIKMETASSFLRKSTKLLSKLKAEKKAENEDAALDMPPLSWDGKEKENTYVIKVEDTERLYRPLFKQFDDAPKIAYNETGSPFDVGVVLVKQNDNPSTKKKSAGGALRGGYCESCDHWYRCSLKEHLSSNKHKEFVSKQENFKTLEEVSNDLPSFSQFLKHNKVKSVGNASEKVDDTVYSNNTNKSHVKSKEVAVGNNTTRYCDENKSNIRVLVENPLFSENIVKDTDQTEKLAPNHMLQIKQSIGFRGEKDFTGSNNMVQKAAEIKCTENESGFQIDFSLSAQHLVGNKMVCLKDSVQQITNIETNHEKRVEHKCSEKSDKIPSNISLFNKKEILPEFSAAQSIFPVASFSSSSNSYGDDGVRNALSILQNSISVSNTSHGKNSTDIFSNNDKGTEHTYGSLSGGVIEKSEISVESRVSGLNNQVLHTPRFDKFLNERDKENKDGNIPVLFNLSETDIENSMMQVINKHMVPDLVKKGSFSGLNSAVCETGNGSAESKPTVNITVPENEKLYDHSNENCQKALSDPNKMEKMNIEASLNTPKSKMTKQIHDQVQNSGSTITPIRNWLLPDQNNGSICSDLSLAKMNDTLVGSVDGYVTDSIKLHEEQLTESEQKQQNLVANWIQTQEFGTSSENYLAAAETDLKVSCSLETPKKDSVLNNNITSRNIKTPVSDQFEDKMSSRDITTPVSEMYNDQYSDLSSIPTDSVISDGVYTPSLKHFNKNGCDNDKINDSVGVHVEETETRSTERVVVQCNTVSDNQDSKYETFSQSFLKTNTVCSKPMTENFKSDMNVKGSSLGSLTLSGEEANRNLNKQQVVCPSSSSANTNCVSATLSENIGLNIASKHELSTCVVLNKVSDKSVNLSAVEEKENIMKKKFVEKEKKEKVKKTVTTKADEPIEKCHTPASNISYDSAAGFQNSFNMHNNLIQQQAYSPISSDHFMHHQHSQSYNMMGVQSPTLMSPLLSENPQQFHYQDFGNQNQFCHEQSLNYYNTGLLPGQNYYSEERHAFYQNNIGMRSQQYGFSGFTDFNSFAVFSPQQCSNNVFSHSQGNYSASHTINTNIMGVQNFQGIGNIDFLDNSGFSQNTSQCSDGLSSPNTFYPDQTLQHLPTSGYSSQEFSQIQNNSQLLLQPNHQYSQQCYPNAQQFPQGYQSTVSQDFSTVSQGFYQQSQDSKLSQGNNQLYLSSLNYSSQNVNQGLETGTRTFETISLNDIAEENCSSSVMPFSQGRFKTSEKMNFRNTSNSSNRKHEKTMAKKRGRKKSVTDDEMNRKCEPNAKSFVPLQTSFYASSHSYSSGPAVSASVIERNEVPLEQHLKSSFILSSDTVHRQQQTHLNEFEFKANQVDNSYTSSKLGDTKIKIKKLGTSQGGKKTDLKDYWNVKKTGDCRLVFRTNKRKADDEVHDNRGDFVPYIDNSVTEKRYGGLHEAKRRRCVVY